MPTRKHTEKATAMDLHAGARVRLRRIFLGLTQQQLGEMVHTITQQLQKYERGVNRMSVGKLYELSLALNVPISYFFDEFGESEGPREAPPHLRRQLGHIQVFVRLNDDHQHGVADLARTLLSEQEKRRKESEPAASSNLVM